MVSLIEKNFAAAPKVPRPTPQDIGVKAYAQSFAIVASDPEVRTEQIAITRLEPARAPTTTVSQLRDDLVASLGEMAFNRRLDDKVATGKTSYLSGGVSSGNESGVLYMAESAAREARQVAAVARGTRARTATRPPLRFHASGRSRTPRRRSSAVLSGMSKRNPRVRPAV